MDAASCVCGGNQSICKMLLRHRKHSQQQPPDLHILNKENSFKEQRLFLELRSHVSLDERRVADGHCKNLNALLAVPKSNLLSTELRLDPPAGLRTSSIGH